MSFEGELAEKDELLGKKLKFLIVSEPKKGNLGGEFRVADFELEGKRAQVALGQILCKEWDSWVAGANGQPTLPCIAVIKKQKGKRYYSFSSIESA